MSWLAELKFSLKLVRKHSIPMELLCHPRGARIGSCKGVELRLFFQEENALIHQVGMATRTLFAIHRNELKDMDAYVLGKLELMIKDAETMISYGYEQTSFASFSRSLYDDLEIQVRRFHDSRGYVDMVYCGKDMVSAILQDGKSKTYLPHSAYGTNMIAVMLSFEKEFLTLNDMGNMNAKLRDELISR